MLRTKNIRSEIVFEQKERIKCIEFIHEDRKFVLVGIKDSEPLFRHLNPEIIRKYADVQLTGPLRISDVLTVEPYSDLKRSYRVSHK